MNSILRIFRFQTYMGGALLGFTAAHIWHMSDETVGGFSKEHFEKLSPETFQGLRPEQIEHLEDDAISGLNESHVSEILLFQPFQKNK